MRGRTRGGGVVVGVLLVLLLSGCDLGRIPEAERPRPSPSATPEYLGDAALERIYGSADRMVAALRAVTDARIEECQEIGPSKITTWTHCWEDLLEPVSRTLLAFGAVAAKTDRADTVDRCDRALERITTQAGRAAEKIDGALARLASERPEVRTEASDSVLDVVDDASSDIGGTSTRFERYCVDPEDQREDAGDA